MVIGSSSVPGTTLGSRKHWLPSARTAVRLSEELAAAEGPLRIWTLAVVVIAAGIAITDSSLTQVVILVAAIPLIMALAIRSPRTLVLSSAIWLVPLGLLRRVLLEQGSSALLGDPLLLIEPMILGLLAVVALRRGASRDRTALAKGVIALSILALVEVVNPLQGGLTVGLGGLLFVLIPMLAFWVGRSLCDDVTMRRLFLLLALLAIPDAIYGLIQTYVGFPSCDTRWIHLFTSNGAYVALNVGGFVRAFASFSSAGEYVAFLGLSIAIWFAWGRRLGRLPVMVIILGLLGAALFLDSDRSEVVLAALAVGVMLAAAVKVRLSSAALWGIAAIGILYFAVSHVSTQQTPAATATQALVSHQIAGLSEPFNAHSSDLTAHLQEFVSGIRAAFVDPMGHGTGTITIAASKFGGVSQGTESDLSNAGVAFGLPGLIAYLVVAISGLAAAYKVAARRRDWIGIAALGVLVATLFRWTNGDLYSVAWLAWLILGWVDRTSRVDVSANAFPPNFEAKPITSGT